MPCHSECSQKDSLLYVISYVVLGYLAERKPCHTDCSQKASLLCVPFNASSGYLTGRKPCNTECSQTASLLCVPSYVSLDDQTKRKSCHTGCSQQASPLCASSGYPTLRKLYCFIALVAKGTGKHPLCFTPFALSVLQRWCSGVFHTGQRLG